MFIKQINSALWSKSAWWHHHYWKDDLIMHCCCEVIPMWTTVILVPTPFSKTKTGILSQPILFLYSKWQMLGRGVGTKFHCQWTVRFSSFWYDNPASPIHKRFSCRSWAPLVPVGDGDDIITELTWATVNGIAQTCLPGRAKGKFLLLRSRLQWDSNPGQSLSQDSHSTSTPLPPTHSGFNERFSLLLCLNTEEKNCLPILFWYRCECLRRCKVINCRIQNENRIGHWPDYFAPGNDTKKLVATVSSGCSLLLQTYCHRNQFLVGMWHTLGHLLTPHLPGVRHR